MLNHPRMALDFVTKDRNALPWSRRDTDSEKRKGMFYLCYPVMIARTYISDRIPFLMKMSTAEVAIPWTLAQETTPSCNNGMTPRPFHLLQNGTKWRSKGRWVLRGYFYDMIVLWMTVSIISIHAGHLCLSWGRFVSIVRQEESTWIHTNTDTCMCLLVDINTSL